MRPEIVFTKAAPKTGFSEGQESPIAQGVKCGDFVFVSGQGPLDPVTRQVVSDDLAEQTRVTLDNVTRVLEAAGKGVQPARTTVEAAAPRKGVNVEIDAIAVIPR